MLAPQCLQQEVDQQIPLIMGKGSDVASAAVKQSPAVDVQASDSSANNMNLKARATISAAQKDTPTLPATGEEASTTAVVLGGVLAAFGLTLAG